MEIIESIKEVTQGGFDGYVIKTNLQEIKIFIENGQGCCEIWGHLSSEDDFNDYIGAELKNIVQVDDALNVVMKQLEPDCTIFVNVETSKGLLQFAVYNEHNGYYGHRVKITSNQFSTETSL